MATIAFLIGLLLNGGAIQPVTAEDSIAVPVMGQVAIAALVESHPECTGPTSWDFNVDASDGIQILGFAEGCEFAGEFYRPSDGVWQFAVQGS